jgi:hypothetical protein
MQFLGEDAGVWGWLVLLVERKVRLGRSSSTGKNGKFVLT